MLCAVLGWGSQAGAQTCPTATSVYLEDLENCQNSTPDALRAYQSRVVGDRLLSDDGNELRLYSLADPARPALIQTTSYHVPPLGDIDWMMVNVSTAGDYGVATWRTATGLWRWADGRISDRRMVSDRGMHPGVVYVAGSQTFALSSDINEAPGAWALRINSTSSLVPVQSVTGATVSGGVQVGEALYVVQTWGMMTTLEVYSIASDGRLTHAATAGSASGGYSLGLAVSGARLIAASGSLVRLWDVSAPLAPVLLHSVSAPANLAALDGLMAVTARAGVRGSERVWSLVGDRLTDITPRWFVGRWAASAGCVVPRGLALRDGRLYYSQWAVAEAIDLRCLVPVPPAPEAIFADGFESGSVAAWH